VKILETGTISMPVSPGSFESQIDNQLRELDCAANNLAAISQVVSKSRLSRALSGEKALDHDDAVRLLECLKEMSELKEISLTPPNWKEIDQIRAILAQRRENRKQLEEVTKVCNALFIETRWEIQNMGRTK
jgi:hypothetical protein